MLRKFAIVLVATTLVAGTAFAAAPSGTAGATPAAPAAAAASVKAATANPVKTIKTVKHAHKRTHTHFARGKAGTKQVHHLTAAKTHQAQISHQANGAGSAKRS